MNRVLAFLLLAACPLLPANSQVVVNEIEVANIDQFIDFSYNYGAWLELYNSGEEAVSIKGWYISDDKNDLTQCVFPSNFRTIAAGGYEVLYFDHTSSDGTYGNYSYKQIGMKLSCEGGVIYISDSSGNLILSQEYPAAISRCSWARVTDGDESWSWSADPTPGASNNEMIFAEEQLDEPEISRNSMTFSSSLTVKVAVPEGATLVYTTNGSTPTLTNGTQKTEDASLSVSTHRVYRFRLFMVVFTPSEAVTRCSINPNNTWSLPIVSLTANDADLYDDTIGCYTTGTNGISGRGISYNSNRNMDWERPVHFDYITTDNKNPISQECTFYVSGGWSRHWTPTSFKLKAEKRYQLQNSFDYRFFDDKPYNKHKVILLRNGGNDTYSRCRDVFIQRMVQTADFYIDTQAWNPCHVFINGSYLAMLNMREPNNKFFAYSNYGIDTDEVDAFEYSGAYTQKAGTRDAYTQWQNLTATASDASTWEQIRDLVDVDEFCNYMAAEAYIGSNDWLTNGNNIKGFRDQNNGRFHMVMFDTDACFAYNNMITTLVNYTSYTLGVIFTNMLKNEDFKRQFINAYCLADGSVFTDARATEVAQEIGDILTEPLGFDNRWPWSTLNDVKNALTNYRYTRMNALKTAFGLDTPGKMTVKANIDEAQLTIDGQPIPLANFDGKLFAPFTLRATAPAGYNFRYWTKDGVVTGYDRELTISKNEDCALEAVFYPLDDEYLLAEGVTPVMVNEVSAKNSIYVNDYFKKNDWVELYNTTDQDIDLEGYYLSDDESDPEQYCITGEDLADTVIKAHGYLIIWCDKLDPMNMLHANFKLGNDNNACVMLTAPDGSWSNTLTYNAHTGVETVGRYPDGGKAIYLMTVPTIGKANTINSYAEHLSGLDVNAIEHVESDNSQEVNDAPLYNLAGQRVNADYQGVIIKNNNKVVTKKR